MKSIKPKIQEEHLKKAFDLSVQKWFGRTHYQYQTRIAHTILSALIASKNGETVEVPVELPRQSGKTTVVVDVLTFLAVCYFRYFNKPLSIGVFAPQIEQATTDFDRMKTQASMLSPLGLRTTHRTKKTKEELKIPEKWNSKTVRLFAQDGQLLCEVYIFPLAKNSNPESKTLDLVIIEEAQDVNDEKMKQAVFPMLASTNGPRIYIGTAGTRVCYFLRQLQNNPRAIRIALEDVFAQRRAAYKKTGDENHLLYETFVSNEIKTNGEDSDYIQVEFKCKWKIGRGQFTDEPTLRGLVEEWRGLITENRARKVKEGRKEITKEPYPCFVGIDSAKAPDRTWVTVVRENTDKRKNELCNWLVLSGENYEDQFEQILDFLKPYENIINVTIDSTGQGSFMPDKFERHTSYNIRPFKFSLQSKDILYTNLLQVMANKGTSLPDLPKDHPIWLLFQREMLDLQKEYKGRYLSCHHPEGTDENGKPFHDDAPDSWALAEDGYADYKRSEPNITFV